MLIDFKSIFRYTKKLNKKYWNIPYIPSPTTVSSVINMLYSLVHFLQLMSQRRYIIIK